jgi:phage tail protein X
MTKIVETRVGDTVGRLLYRYFGTDDDALEAMFWALNPKLALREPKYPAGVVVVLPDKPKPNTERVVTVWD